MGPSLLPHVVLAAGQVPRLDSSKMARTQVRRQMRTVRVIAVVVVAAVVAAAAVPADNAVAA